MGNGRRKPAALRQPQHKGGGQRHQKGYDQRQTVDQVRDPAEVFFDQNNGDEGGKDGCDSRDHGIDSQFRRSAPAVYPDAGGKMQGNRIGKIFYHHAKKTQNSPAANRLRSVSSDGKSLDGRAVPVRISNLPFDPTGVAFCLYSIILFEEKQEQATEKSELFSFKTATSVKPPAAFAAEDGFFFFQFSNSSRFFSVSSSCSRRSARSSMLRLKSIRR